jgi:hypothetical protein
LSRRVSRLYRRLRRVATMAPASSALDARAGTALVAGLATI